jgi:hypothetical protein
MACRVLEDGVGLMLGAARPEDHPDSTRVTVKSAKAASTTQDTKVTMQHAKQAALKAAPPAPAPLVAAARGRVHLVQGSLLHTGLAAAGSR